MAAADESTGGQIKHQTAIHLLVEVKVEVVQSLIRVAEFRLFFASLQKPVASAAEFIRDQAGDQVYRCHRFDLSLMQTGLKHSGHAAEPKVPESGSEFCRVHY